MFEIPFWRVPQDPVAFRPIESGGEQFVVSRDKSFNFEFSASGHPDPGVDLVPNQFFRIWLSRSSVVMIQLGR
jgi:hypothetical protein